MTKKTDEQLLALFQGRDPGAFEQLVKRYEKPLYNFLVKFVAGAAVAEDVFQETFLQVSISADNFDVTRRFRPWLYTIAANKARDMLRKKGRRPTVQLTGTQENDYENDLWDVLLVDETTPQKLLEQKQQKQMVRDTVMQLPDRLREILALAYFNQLPYKEIAKVLDVPLGTVKSRLHSAIAEFAKQYKIRRLT